MSIEGKQVPGYEKANGSRYERDRSAGRGRFEQGGGERETQKSQSIRRDKQRGKGGGGIEGASELRVVDGFFFRSFPFGPCPRRSTS